MYAFNLCSLYAKYYIILSNRLFNNILDILEQNISISTNNTKEFLFIYMIT